MVDSINEISCDYSTQGQTNTAIQQYNWDSYYGKNKPSYIEVWRFGGSSPTPDTRPKSSQKKYLVNELGTVDNILRIRTNELAPVFNPNWTENSLPWDICTVVDENGYFVNEQIHVGSWYIVDMSKLIDTGEGRYGNGYYWRKFRHGAGYAWLSCWSGDDLRG
ncbi:MAG: hypothetical protein LBT10_01905 [Methanobrevibacter sp.]|nr:hypothetical protein [Methanobrevibacter sp.]